ncbi:MAG: hypothetical protein JNL77_03230 [Nitrosomonas sp.]|nr:hypothetical protein [Nitrosomonas sp.]
MKKPKTVISAAVDARLGMPILKLKDQDDEVHSFHFLPSHFKQLVDALSRAADQAAPEDLYIAESLKAPSSLQKEALKKAVAAARSQSEGYAVMAIPTHDLALLVLRSSSGEEANVQLDKNDIDKLINHLLNAKKIIDPSDRDIH